MASELTPEVELPVPAWVEVLRGAEHQVRGQLHHHGSYILAENVKFLTILDLVRGVKNVNMKLARDRKTEKNGVELKFTAILLNNQK